MTLIALWARVAERGATRLALTTIAVPTTTPPKDRRRALELAGKFASQCARRRLIVFADGAAEAAPRNELARSGVGSSPCGFNDGALVDTSVAGGVPHAPGLRCAGGFISKQGALCAAGWVGR